MKIVVAYSGGLDTSVILSWLKETYGAEMIAFCADVGQGEELDGLEAKALATGASRCQVDDLREEFARDFIFPMIQAGAIYEGQYYLGTSIARPLIAKRMIEIAHTDGAKAVAHGAMTSISGASAKKPYSMDRNLLHISFESGILEDPWFDASAPESRDMYKLSVSPEDAPDQPEYVQLRFEAGNCVGVRGEGDGDYPPMSPLEVMETLNRLGGKHGVGRVDMVENRFVGMKSRGVYETPGGSILHFAHRQMESLTMDREVMHLRDSLIPKYSTLVYNGFWFAPEREALQALVTESQKNVTGEVRVKLYKGNVIAAGRRSPVSLYHPQIATMEADPTQAYNQSDATGFISLNALRLKVEARVQSEGAQ